MERIGGLPINVVKIKAIGGPDVSELLRHTLGGVVAENPVCDGLTVLSDHCLYRPYINIYFSDMADITGLLD
jgi:hypothetical protein